MALNTNPFVEGIDPTATFGGYASVLLQLIRQAQPSSTYGMILFDTTPPDVTGANAWRKRCLWLDLTVPNLPTVNVYKEGGSPGWVNVQAIIPSNTITTAMIQNAAVTLAKLSTSGGAANQLIRVNATATAFEFVSLSSLVVNGSINVGSLITTGIPAGQFRIASTYGPGVANWYTAQSVIDNLANAAIATDLIAPAPAATLRSQFLTTRSGDSFSTWRFFEPSADILDMTLSGAKLQDASVGPVKIQSSGVADGWLLSKVAGVPEWVAPTTVPGSVVQFVTPISALQTIPALTQGTTITLNHTLAAVPLMFRVTLYCSGASGGYVPGDEIDLTTTSQSGLSSDAQPPFMFYVNGSTSIVVRKNLGSDIAILHKTNNTYHTIGSAQLADWRIRLYAMKVA